MFVSLIQVKVIGTMVGHIECFRIHIVYPVVGILVAVRSQCTSVPGNSRGMTLIRIVYHHLILMGMTMEDATNRFMEAGNAAIIFPGPDDPAGAISGWNMGEDMHLFTGSLGGQQSVVEPLQLRDLIRAIVVQPKVIRIAAIAVQSNDAETFPWRDRVVATLENGLLGGFWQPVLPVVVQVLVQPPGIHIFGHIFGTETV